MPFINVCYYLISNNQTIPHFQNNINFYFSCVSLSYKKNMIIKNIF